MYTHVRCIMSLRFRGFNIRLTPNDPYMGRTTPLTSKPCILYIYSTNTGTEYFKRAFYSPFLSLQNAVCFIALTCLVPVLFIFCIQGVLKLKKNNSGAKRIYLFEKLLIFIYVILYTVDLYVRHDVIFNVFQPQVL